MFSPAAVLVLVLVLVLTVVSLESRTTHLGLATTRGACLGAFARIATGARDENAADLGSGRGDFLAAFSTSCLRQPRPNESIPIAQLQGPWFFPPPPFSL